METFISQMVLSRVLLPADGRPMMATVAHFMGMAPYSKYREFGLPCIETHRRSEAKKASLLLRVKRYISN